MTPGVTGPARTLRPRPPACLPRARVCTPAPCAHKSSSRVAWKHDEHLAGSRPERRGGGDLREPGQNPVFLEPAQGGRAGSCPGVFPGGSPGLLAPGQDRALVSVKNIIQKFLDTSEPSLCARRQEAWGKFGRGWDGPSDPVWAHRGGRATPSPPLQGPSPGASPALGV